MIEKNAYDHCTKINQTCRDLLVNDYKQIYNDLIEMFSDGYENMAEQQKNDM